LPAQFGIREQTADLWTLCKISNGAEFHKQH
jgi:hypothetical protein